MDLIHSRYNHLFEHEGRKIVYNSLSNSTIEVSDVIFSFLKDKKADQTIFESIIQDNEMLRKFMIITTKAEEDLEINNLKLINLMHRFDKSFMSLTICPTSYCNFACKYCYEESRPNIFMSDETESKLIEFVDQRDLKELSVMWFGGEPLLNLQKIISISDKLLNNKYLYGAGMITNGYLLNRDVIKMLDHLRIGYLQITIDGLETTHNLRRPHIGGGNSFKTIIDNIDSFCEINPKTRLNIRVNIDKTNENEYIELDAFLQNRYLSKNKNIFITPAYVSDFKGGCHNNCIFDRRDKASFILKNYKNVNLYPRLQHLGCMTRQVNSFLINADGAIYKCYNDIGNKSMEIANLHKKGINADLLTTYLMDADFYGDHECSNCSILPVCGGGCPYLRIQNKKKSITEGGENCEVIKDFEKDFILSHINKMESI